MHRLVFALLLTHALVAFAEIQNVEKDYEEGDTHRELLERFGKRLFSMTCDRYEELYTNYTRCLWPHGDPADFMRQVLKSGVSVGCKMPPRRVIKAGLEFLGSEAVEEIKEHPLYGKLPDMPCGLCSRRIRCCTRARSFFTQAFNSTECGIDTMPCNIEPMTDDEMTKLNELHPGVHDGVDRCNYSAFIEASLDKLHDSDVFPFVRRAVCQMLGTTRPNVNCISVDDTCKCCCTGSHYDPKKDVCVANKEITIDENCIDME